MKFLLILLAAIMPAAAIAQAQVALSSEVFVERAKTEADGKTRVVLEAPEVVTPGDKLVFVLDYKNGSATPAADFVVTNPIPDAVVFAGTESPGAVYSVDGGKVWGPLAALKVAAPDGTSRAAAPADVTHVRWAFSQAIAPASGGKLSFRGVVE